jgi:hypothetical protein
MKPSEFGFLQKPLKGDFLGISFSPLADHAERLELLKKGSNIDGFYYPPQIAKYHVDPPTDSIKEKIAQTDRPASVYSLSPSHTITIENPVSIDKEPCSDEALIVFLLAYLYGTRLMPSQWKFEGRVPIKPVNNFYISDTTTLHFLEYVYSWWKSLTKTQRIKFVNILYVYTRATSLEWDWDAFLHQYMVFDALYNFHIELRPTKRAKNHQDRFNILCNEYSVSNEDLVNRIYSARHNLFHEAMWIESTIGFGSPNNDTYQLPQYLSALNSQIISGITGYQNQYIHTEWWTRQMLDFDKMS